MTVYVVCRKWQEDFDIDICVTHDLNTAIETANDFVDEIYVDGYTIDPDYNDNESKYFTSEDYKIYIDGDGDFSVNIWIEKQVLL